jgi:dienelactone hydrolase
VISQTVSINSLQTDIYYPNASQCGTAIAAPYPAIAFAHGFSMFGLSDGRAENAGNGQHLASWGYVAAIPSLPDDAEQRVTDLRAVLSYLANLANKPGPFLYRKLDRDRLAVAGHSLGGATALAAAARDGRVKAVVALDPVYHEGSFGQEGDEIWHPDAEGPDIKAPTGILGAPASSCNANADYADIYPLVGATHKASFHIVRASHCDFTDPGNMFCGFTCGASSPARTELSQRYMTAWFNYYLHYKTDYYTYLYGAEAGEDISAGLIQRQVDTAPRGLTAIGLPSAVALNWQLYDHPMVAGYHIFRRTAGQAYPSTPLAQVGKTYTYLDTGRTPGTTHWYKLRSYDPAGNPHQITPQEVSAVPWIAASTIYLPILMK